MKIVQLSGGLGNQLYQFAFGFALAKESGDTVLFDNFWFEHNRKTKKYTQRDYELNLVIKNVPLATRKQIRNVKSKSLCPRFLRKFFKIDSNKNIVIEENWGRFSSKYFKYNGDKYYTGFWTNERYFKKYINDLQKCFELQMPMDVKNKNWLKIIKKTNSVSVHIRRGDYVTNGLYMCNISYYKRAFEKIAKKIDKPVFFVFSDDIAWARENIKTKHTIYFVDNNDSAHGCLDFELMRNCKHNITANSTFSIWASYLNPNKNKIIIMPKRKGT